VNNINLTFKNNIWIKDYKNGLSNNFSKKFDKIFLEIKSDIKNKDKTLHVLDKNFKFNFNVKDLKNFKKFKSIAFIGIGGSILGTEAIYNFFRTRIKNLFITASNNYVLKFITRVIKNSCILELKQRKRCLDIRSKEINR